MAVSGHYEYIFPDPNLLFLGDHFTPRFNVEVWLGPNALLDYSRPAELLKCLGLRGTQTLLKKNLGFGLKELYKSAFIRAQVSEFQRFVPSLHLKGVQRGPAGIRAQVVNLDGYLVDDFVLDSGKGPMSVIFI